MNITTQLYLMLSNLNTIEATIIASFIGLLIGSFSNVVIHRLPVMMEREWKHACEQEMGIESDPLPKYNLSLPRSACVNCNHQIKWYDNIPVISWLILRGKCRKCKMKISYMYPLVEFLIGIISGVTVFLMWPSPLAIFIPIAITMAFILMFIDIKHMILPDSLTLPLLWIALILSSLNILPVSPTMSIIGAASAYGFFYMVNGVIKIWKGVDGMGYGDVKYMAAVGAWFGPLQIYYIILAICILALCIFAFAEIVSKTNFIDKNSESYKQYQDMVENSKSDLGYMDHEEFKEKRIMPLGPSISIVFMIHLIMTYLF